MIQNLALMKQWITYTIIDKISLKMSVSLATPVHMDEQSNRWW